MYFFAQFDLSRRFLTCLNYSTAPMVAQMVSSIFHVALCYLIAVKFEFGIRGLGIASMLTFASMFFFVELYARSVPRIRKIVSWPNRSSFRDWGSYLTIAIPATGALVAEGWAY